MTLQQILRGCWRRHQDPTLVVSEGKTLFECPRCFAQYPILAGAEDFWVRQVKRDRKAKRSEARKGLPQIPRRKVANG